MKDDIKKPWIEAGYHFFAKDGPQGLKIELIAKAVFKSKSSFYHLFADLDAFIEQLLLHHQERAISIAAEAKACKNMVPEVLNLLISVKQDILFDRQLRIHRNVPAFKKCFEQANGMVEEAFLEVWRDALGLKENTYLARIILNLTVDNFYLRVTEDSLNYEWLIDFLKEIRFMVNEITKNR